ncbi:MAG: histidine kinase [Betaproteobacteria bacterium]|nr:histidine kinase [Betaproteobacteria bacterium]
MDAWLTRWRRELALGGCLVVAAGILVVSELGHRSITHRYQSAMQSIATSVRLNTLSARLADAETGQRSFLLTAKREYLEPYEDAVPQIRKLLDELRPHYALHPDADAEKVYATLIAAIGAKLGEIDLTLDLTEHARIDRALEIVQSGVGQRTMDEIRFLLEDLSRREDNSARTIAEGWHASLALSRLGIALVAALNVVLVVALFFGLKRDWRVSNERQDLLNRHVRERTRQLDSLASRLQEAAEAERSALARELHDELGALLTASKMDIAWIRGRLGEEHAALHQKLARVIQHLDQGMVAKRRIVEGLRPSTLSTFGLATAARELTEQVAERAGWDVELELPEIDPQLPEEVEIALFRVLQESLTNATKYAQATRVRVRLGCEPLHCRLEVEDNGRGFRAGEMRSGAQGLFGMRQRTEARGGSLHVLSAPGSGTLIRALLPVQSPPCWRSSRPRESVPVAPAPGDAHGIAGA